MIKWIKKLIYITIAIIILSVCVNMFYGPHNIAAGGLTGLGIILEDLINMDRSTIIMIGNIIVLIITFIFLGKEIFLSFRECFLLKRHFALELHRKKRKRK